MIVIGIINKTRKAKLAIKYLIAFLLGKLRVDIFRTQTSGKEEKLAALKIINVIRGKIFTGTIFLKDKLLATNSPDWGHAFMKINK